MLRSIFILIISVNFLNISSQEADSLNFTDSNGNKQGHWIKYHETGFPLYDGYFLDNRPINEFKRFYDDGNLLSVLNYKTEYDTVKAKFYHPNGYLAGQGSYVDQNKQGVWEFFSDRLEACLVCRESYSDNIKQGKSIKYHWNGNIAEELIYADDIKDGLWKQFYIEGEIFLKSTFVKDKLNGKFEVFLPDGNPEITGQYKNDARNGAWLFYNSDGTFKKKITFRNGKAENQAELNKEESDYLDRLEKEGRKIKDPEKTGIIW